MPSEPRGFVRPRFAVVETKITPPLPAECLQREQCLQQLSAVFDARLTLVLAPTGSGKTTLLSQWITQLPDAIYRAWLSVEPCDNDLGRFYFNLLAAVKRNIPTFKGYLISHLEQAESIADDMIDAIVALLAKLDRPLVIVLDDMQCIVNDTIITTLQRLISLLPPNCHVVWCSRHTPPFSTTRLKLESQLFQLPSQCLNFSRDDISVLARKLNGLTLNALQCERLWQATEGWIAGIKLALLGGELTRTLEHFSGAHRDVVDYLGTAVLSQLDASMQEFLLCTSILPRLNASLCDALLQRTDSSRTLQSLHKQQLFLQSLDNTNESFRYHALFREFLHNQLLIKNASLVPVLHARAALWFGRQHEFDIALTHARESHDTPLRDHILEQAFALWFKQGEFNRIVQWSEVLEDSPAMHHSRITGHLVAALLFARKFNQATYHLDQLSARAQRECDEEARTLVHFLTSALEFFQNDDAFRITQPISIDYARYNIDLFHFSQVTHAYYLLLRYNHAQALREAQCAEANLKMAGHHFLASFGTMIQTLVDREQCRMLDARNRIEKACAAAGSERTPEWINLNSVLAVVRYEQNRTAEAADLCRELLPHLSTTCATEVITAVYLTLTRICVGRGALREGAALLKHLGKILALGYYDRFTTLIQMEKIRLAYATGDTSELTHLATQLRLPERWRNGEWRKSRIYDESWHRHGQALVYWQMANNLEHDAVTVLDTLATSAERAGCRRQAVILLALRAVCHQRLQQSNPALQCVQNALRHGDWPAISRSVFDEAPGFGLLLIQLIQHKQLEDIPPNYLNAFDDILQNASAPQKTRALSEPFTDKEAEIVALLSEGLSNKAISERAGIALATTKWHLKNIYTKLDVQTRTEAVVKLDVKHSAR